MLDKWAFLQFSTPDTDLQLKVNIIDMLDSVLSETGVVGIASVVQPVAFHLSQLPTKNEPGHVPLISSISISSETGGN